MSATRREFSTILLERGLAAEQLAEAQQLCQQTGVRLDIALVKLGYATAWEVLVAVAEASGIPCVDLSEVVIPLAVVELVPESVARENFVLPLAASPGALTIVIAEDNPDTVQKLSFILNRHIQPVLALREQIAEAINRHYGETETESVDSMLAEFTDTAIDFTESAPCLEDESTEFALCLEDEAPSPGQSAEGSLTAAATQKSRQVSRRATVRHYSRMSRDRMFPLLVILSEKQIREVAKAGVSQKASGPFRVAAGSVVEVEPVLPGCACYPPRANVVIGSGDAQVTFYVVPHVLGRVMEARVVVRQGTRTLAEVSLDICVTRQVLTAALGVMSCLLPLLFVFLRHYRLDLESQLADGFDLYTAAAAGLLQWLSPAAVAGLLLLATGGAYLWLRPRQRDVFFDVEPVSGGEEIVAPPLADVPTVAPAFAPAAEAKATKLERAERLFAKRDYFAALQCYRDALGLGAARPEAFHRAALAAGNLGRTEEALSILEEAAARLPASQMKGVMWFNMGCFATRLGRFDDAIKYLHRAVDAGFTKADKYRHDPDLAALRWRPAFKALLASMEQALAR
jgi:hypothetical protein